MLKIPLFKYKKVVKYKNLGLTSKIKKQLYRVSMKNIFDAKQLNRVGSPRCRGDGSSVTVVWSSLGAERGGLVSSSSSSVPTQTDSFSSGVRRKRTHAHIAAACVCVF